MIIVTLVMQTTMTVLVLISSVAPISRSIKKAVRRYWSRTAKEMKNKIFSLAELLGANPASNSNRRRGDKFGGNHDDDVELDHRRRNNNYHKPRAPERMRNKMMEKNDNQKYDRNNSRSSSRNQNQ